MSLQQAVQQQQQQQGRSSAAANGYGRKRGGEKDINTNSSNNVIRMDSSSKLMQQMPAAKANSSNNRVGLNSGIASGSKGGVGSSVPPQDRLVYLFTCLVGHHVDVHVKNGSVYSGIFHSTDNDFGVILKMARLTKDRFPQGQKYASERAPSKTLIIPAIEVVQVIAKDVPVTSDGFLNEMRGDKQQDLLLDSCISQSRHAEVERELAPWVPDENGRHPELENIFDSPWTGGWDQFKVNEKLFGVKSTFDEEIYTTKLHRGPQMRELEVEAMRIAREIEGEETHDLHLAEERGTYLHGNIDIDEETKYSSVYRGTDDGGNDEEDVMFNSRDTETFGDSGGLGFGRSFADVTSGKSVKSVGGGRLSSKSSSKDELQFPQFKANRELFRSGSLASDNSSVPGHSFQDDSRLQENHFEQGGNAFIEETAGAHTFSEEYQTTKPADAQLVRDAKRDGSEKASVSSVVATQSSVSTSGDKIGSSDNSEDGFGKVSTVKEPLKSRGRLGISAPSTSDSGATSAPSAPGLTPSSSVGSLSSEKSTLNPNAKEFRLNPNAKSFVPFQAPLRPVSPVNDSSFYFPTTMPGVQHMHGMPVGIGVGPSFAGHQPVLFTPQAAAMQSPPAYFPANGPQYGQHMILGHPRQVMYMPGYPGDPYK